MHDDHLASTEAPGDVVLTGAPSNPVGASNAVGAR